MPLHNESTDALYDAMLFARTPEAARAAGKELVRAVLGDRALRRPLKETLKECCRTLRPAADPKDESRFEDEFVELAIWPGKADRIAA